MIIESSNYIINIDKSGIKIENKVDNTILNMKLFTDYNYDILNIGLGLGQLDKTILKAEYCRLDENEYYDMNISIFIDSDIELDIEGINMDNNILENICNIKDKVIYISTEL